jgi:hypothetical protein
MKFGLGVPSNPKESDSENSERTSPENITDLCESPEGSPSRFRPNPIAMEDNHPANNPIDPAMQALQNQLAEMKTSFEAIVSQQNQTIASLANLATSAQQQPPPKLDNYSDLMLRQFIKDPVLTHNRTNPQKPILAFDGSNYVEWEKAIDCTLQHAFVRNTPFIVEDNYDNFDTIGIVPSKKIAELMINTLHVDLLTIVESEGLTLPKDLLKALREKCRRSGRRHKVILVNKLIKFAGERSPASESWLARFCTMMTDIERAKITINEFAGLLLQSLATAPTGVDSKNFDYSINQPLDNMSNIPTLGEVTTVIQSALSKAGSSGHLPPGSIPSDVEMAVQAMRHQPQTKYTPPQKRSDENSQNSGSSKFSVEKATFYKGKGHSDSLLAKFGYACLYCRETGHWYSDCNLYWQDVRQGRVEAPPASHNDEGS